MAEMECNECAIELETHHEKRCGLCYGCSVFLNDCNVGVLDFDDY